jgi:hypothetical protein
VPLIDAVGLPAFTIAAAAITAALIGWGIKRVRGCGRVRRPDPLVCCSRRIDYRRGY